MNKHKNDTWYVVNQPTCCAYCQRNHTRLLAYSRTNNEFCLSLQQYPVGDSRNIHDGMRATGRWFRRHAKSTGEGPEQRHVVPGKCHKYISCCHKKHTINYSYVIHFETRTCREKKAPHAPMELSLTCRCLAWSF